MSVDLEERVRAGLRGMVTDMPETPFDARALISTGRRRRRQRWLGAAATATVVVAGALVLNTTGLPPYRSTPVGLPVTPTAPPAPAALAPVTKLLEQWGFEPGSWDIAASGAPNGRVALAASGTYAFVSTGVSRVAEGTEPGCADECVVTKDTTGTLDHQMYFETVWMSEPDRTAVILRKYGNGAWVWVSMPGLAVGSLDVHPDRPFVSLGRLELLANAVGVPTVGYVEPGPMSGEIARAVLPGSGTSAVGQMRDGVDYLLRVLCVAEDRTAELTVRVRTADKAGTTLLSGTDRCDGTGSHQTGFTYRMEDPHRVRVEISGPPDARAYAILAPAY